MATILFNNGYEITAELNGNCFITDNKPNFPTDLFNITITTDDKSYIVEHGEIIEAASVDNRYWFTIIERTLPYKETKTAYIEDTTLTFENVPTGNLSVFSMVSEYNVNRDGETVIIDFAPLEEVTEFTIMVQ